MENKEDLEAMQLIEQLNTRPAQPIDITTGFWVDGGNIIEDN